MSEDAPQPANAEPPPDPFTDAVVDAIMGHAAGPNGADYPKVAATFAQLIAEMIGPQPHAVRKAMVADFERSLERAVNVAALRASVVNPGVLP